MRADMIRKIAYTMCALSVLSACAGREPIAESSLPSAGTPLQLWICADLHYLSPSLHDEGTVFRQLVEQGDGKIPEYSEQIVDEFIRLALLERPDAIIIPGDLTYNGEYVSLQELCDKLKVLQDSGIPVLVIPGNHDLNYSYARTYFGSNARTTQNISEKEFRALCADFGWNQASAQDRSSYSYVYPLTEDVELLFLDANTPEAPGEITSSTWNWAKKQLNWANEDGKTVITITHQSILPQNKFMTAGFLINNSDDVKQLLRDHGVFLNLSGHIHIQHTAEEDGLTDIATGCICVSPLRYGVLDLPENRMDYEYIQNHLDILQSEAEERFKTCMTGQILSSLEDIDLTEEEKDSMVQYMIRLNAQYYSGDALDVKECREQAGYLLWKEHGAQTFWYSYIESMLND